MGPSSQKDRGQVAVDPFWPGLIFALIGISLLVVQDVVGAI